MHFVMKNPFCFKNKGEFGNEMQKMSTAGALCLHRRRGGECLVSFDRRGCHPVVGGLGRAVGVEEEQPQVVADLEGVIEGSCGRGGAAREAEDLLSI